MQHIIIVDENDNVIGEEKKQKCHEGDGILHRGFLVMVFNKAGELLLARRSKMKRLWPDFWDGTVASHVLKGETYEQAAKRRLNQEIGLITDNIQYVFKFHYKVRYWNIGTENEICAVMVVKGVHTDTIFPDSNEISEIEPINLHVLMDDFRKNKQTYTPWLILAIEHMHSRHIGASNSQFPIIRAL